MFPWLGVETQPIVGCPVDVIESRECTQLQQPLGCAWLAAEGL